MLLAVYTRRSENDFDDCDLSVRLLVMQIINPLLTLESQTLNTLLTPFDTELKGFKYIIYIETK